MTSTTAVSSVGMQRSLQRPAQNILPAAGAAGSPQPLKSEVHQEAIPQPNQHNHYQNHRENQQNSREEQMKQVEEDDDSFMDWETRDEKIPLIKHMIAGSCAGVMEHLGMFPLDTIKTHAQASGRMLGVRSIAQILYKDEGLLRFWKGAQVMASGCVPAHAAYFLTYEHWKMYFKIDNEEINLMQTFFIGGTTTFVHDLFIAPADVMKQRLQLCKNLSATQCFRDIINQEGIKGLYRSYPLTVSMNIPFASCVVCCNENLKTIFRPWERQHSYIWYFICAGTAGGIAGLITNPLDVIKTRLQTQEVQPSCERLRNMWKNEKQAEDGMKQKTSCCEINRMGSGGHHKDCSFQVRSIRYADVLSTFRYIQRTEGLIAFTKGVLPRMSINVPSTALSWGTYELVKSYLIGDETTKD